MFHSVKRRWTKSVQVRTADPVSVVKCETPVGEFYTNSTFRGKERNGLRPSVDPTGSTSSSPGQRFPGTSFCGRGGYVPTPERWRSEEHTSELQSQSNLVCRLLLEKKK